MKRAGNLLDAVADWDNLRLAAVKALRGKRGKDDARLYVANLDANLRRLGEQVRANSVPVGRFHQFTIHDPKERLITAPCFEERVLHHAILNVCEPVFERWLIDDAYACRRGKGRVACLQRAQIFARRHPIFLKLDVRKYFDSIDQATLKHLLARRFKDGRLLALLGRIIDSYAVTPGKGVPIGSLTSQHFANFYLGWCDRFIKEERRVPGYVRYMDDMALWAGSTAELSSTLEAMRSFLAERLQLTVKPEPYLNRTGRGMDFLGCRLFPTHLRLNGRSRRRLSPQAASPGPCLAGGPDERTRGAAAQRGPDRVHANAGREELAFAPPRDRAVNGGRPRPRLACSAAGAGTTTAGTAGQRTATGTSRTTGTTTTGSAWPQLQRGRTSRGNRPFSRPVLSTGKRSVRPRVVVAAANPPGAASLPCPALRTRMLWEWGVRGFLQPLPRQGACLLEDVASETLPSSQEDADAHQETLRGVGLSLASDEDGGRLSHRDGSGSFGRGDRVGRG